MGNGSGNYVTQRTENKADCGKLEVIHRKAVDNLLWWATFLEKIDFFGFSFRASHHVTPFAET
jgi:hypothetical protein